MSINPLTCQPGGDKKNSAFFDEYRMKIYERRQSSGLEDLLEKMRAVVIQVEQGDALPYLHELYLMGPYRFSAAFKNTTHNVYLDGALAFTWSGFTANEQWLEQSFLTPESAQFVKIETVESLSWVAWYEIEVLVNPVPLPAAAWLFSTGLLGLIGLARRKSS